MENQEHIKHEVYSLEMSRPRIVFFNQSVMTRVRLREEKRLEMYAERQKA